MLCLIHTHLLSGAGKLENDGYRNISLQLLPKLGTVVLLSTYNFWISGVSGVIRE